MNKEYDTVESFLGGLAEATNNGENPITDFGIDTTRYVHYIIGRTATGQRPTAEALIESPGNIGFPSLLACRQRDLFMFFGQVTVTVELLSRLAKFVVFNSPRSELEKLGVVCHPKQT